MKKNDTNSEITKIQPEIEEAKAETAEEYRSRMLRKMSEAAETLTYAKKLEKVREALASIRRIQLAQPLEVRIKACNLAMAATCENLVRAAAVIVEKDGHNAFARDVLKDLFTLQNELGDRTPVMWARRFTPPPGKEIIYKQLDGIKAVCNHSEYTQAMKQIYDWMSTSTSKYYSPKLRLEQSLTDLLIALVIPNQIEKHPEDQWTAFLLSVWNVLRDVSNITGLGAHGALSFLWIDDTSVRLLLPNRLNEGNPPEHFLFCAQAIRDVANSLSFTFIQDLFEQLTGTLRTCLEKDLLASVDDGEVILNSWTKAEMELLYKVQKAKDCRTGSDDINDLTHQIYMLTNLLGECTEDVDIGCFSETTYALLQDCLRDRTILSMVSAIDLRWKLSDWTKGILPLYIALLSRASRGRRDFWNDPLFQSWERSIKAPPFPGINSKANES